MIDDGWKGNTRRHFLWGFTRNAIESNNESKNLSLNCEQNYDFIIDALRPVKQACKQAMREFLGCFKIESSRKLNFRFFHSIFPPLASSSSLCRSHGEPLKVVKLIFVVVSLLLLQTTRSFSVNFISHFLDLKMCFSINIKQHCEIGEMMMTEAEREEARNWKRRKKREEKSNFPIALGTLGPDARQQRDDGSRSFDSTSTFLLLAV